MAIGMFVVAAGLWLLWDEQPGTATYVISLTSVLIGVAFVVGIAVAVRLGRK